MNNSFERQIEAARQRLETLQQHAGGTSPEQAALAMEALEELSNALEELHVAGEELRQQNDELAAARQAMEAERQRYQELFEFAPDGYLVTDPEGVIQEANRAAARLLGVRQDFLPGKPLVVFVADALEQADHAAFHTRLTQLQAAHTDKLEDWELWLQPREGAPFPVQVTVGCVCDASGRLAGLRWLLRDITERVRAEAKLLEEEERFRIAAETANDVVYEWDLKQRVQWFGKIDALLGYDPDEFPRTLNGWAAAVHPEDQERVMAAVQAHLDGRAAYDVEYRILRKDGGYQWWAARGAVARTPDGKPVRWIGTITDITERKRAEADVQRALQESRQRQSEVSALLQGSRAVLERRSFRDAAQIIFETCKNLLGATGGYISLLTQDGTQNEVVFLDAGGLPCAVNPDLPMPIRGLRERSVQSGRAIYENNFAGSEWAALLPAGHVCLDNILFAPLMVGGVVVGLMGLGNKAGGFTDNDVRLAGAFAEQAAIALFNSRALEALRQARDELEQRVQERTAELAQANKSLRLQSAALEAAANGIIITDRQGNVQWCNPAFTQMTGYTAQEILGQNTRFLKSGQHDPELYRQLWETVFSGQVWRGEMINQRKDGSFYPEEQTITPVLDESGALSHFIAIKQDITTRKLAEAALQLERDKLKGILDAMQDGVYIVNQQCDIEYINPVLEKEFGPSNGRKCYEYFHDRTLPCPWCVNQAVFAGQSVQWEWYSFKTGKTYDLFDTPLRGAGGTISKLEIFHDITAHKQADEEIKRRNRELAALNAISIAVSGSLELSEVLTTCQCLLTDQLDVPGGAISFYDEHDDQLHVQTCWGLPEDISASFRMTLAAAFHGQRAFAEKEAALAPDLSKGLAVLPPGPNISLSDWPSHLRILLLAGGKLQGVLDLFKRTQAAFDPSQASFFEAFGRVVGIAIQNARLYEAELRARRTAETLCAASSALTQSLNLDTVLDTLLEYVERLVPYDSACVVLLDGDSRLVVRAVRGYERWTDPAQVRSIAVDASAYPRVHEMLTTRQTILISDLCEYPAEMRPIAMQHVRTWLGVPLVAGDRVIGLCGLDKTEPGFFSQEHVQLAEALVSQAAVAVQNAWLFEQVDAGRMRLQSLSRRLVEVQEAERRYIARELHDEAGQALTSLIVSLRLLEKEAHSPDRVLARAADLRQTTDSILENLHRLAMDLRPVSLDHLGLVAALRQYVESHAGRHGLSVAFEALGLASIRLPSDMETALYRIVQEALTNAIRHAQATHIGVLLERRQDRIVAIIEDNGIGFDPQAALQRGRLGLSGMYERAEMLGGTLTIEADAAAGTTVFVEVPHADSNTRRG